VKLVLTSWLVVVLLGHIIYSGLGAHPMGIMELKSRLSRDRQYPKLAKCGAHFIYNWLDVFYNLFFFEVATNV
jgi:hypothetical protein